MSPRAATSSRAAAGTRTAGTRRPPEHPLLDVLHLLGGKWAMHVLFHLKHGRVLRFSELQRLIPAVAQKELTKRLRELERAGLVSRTVHAEVPPRVEYRLTALAATLAGPIDDLAKWAEKHAAEIAKHRDG